VRIKAPRFRDKLFTTIYQLLKVALNILFLADQLFYAQLFGRSPTAIDLCARPSALGSVYLSRESGGFN
jgi:hypothetical protein